MSFFIKNRKSLYLAFVFKELPVKEFKKTLLNLFYATIDAFSIIFYNS